MYTFYFQEIKNQRYKFVAFKGFEVPHNMKLGQSYYPVTADALVASGYRVVIQPRRMTDSDASTQMFYAPGWRNSKIAENAKIDQAFASALAWTEFGDDEVPATKQEFINWANGEVKEFAKDFCSEDFGQDPIHVDSIEYKSSVGDRPGIGPLPPQAPLAHRVECSKCGRSWTGEVGMAYEYQYWTPEHGEIAAPEKPIPPDGSMLIPELAAWPRKFAPEVPEIEYSDSKARLIKIAENAKPSWRQLFKKWFNPEF
jgi:hypothetical protein